MILIYDFWLHCGSFWICLQIRQTLLSFMRLIWSLIITSVRTLHINKWVFCIHIKTVFPSFKRMSFRFQILLFICILSIFNNAWLMQYFFLLIKIKMISCHLLIYLNIISICTWILIFLILRLIILLILIWLTGINFLNVFSIFFGISIIIFLNLNLFKYNIL